MREILIFSALNASLENLPVNLKEIWLKKGTIFNSSKLPFGCEIKYF